MEHSSLSGATYSDSITDGYREAYETEQEALSYMS